MAATLTCAAFVVAAVCMSVGVPSSGAAASFPGRNGRIAFVSDRTGNPDIWTMNRRGGRLRQLTRNPESDLHPAWSADGRYVAFTRLRDDGSDIYVMTATGARQQRLTRTPEAFEDFAAWSPTGRKISFASARDGDVDIYTMKLTRDASGRWRVRRVTNLTDNVVDDFDPEWSPDGKKIAYFSGSVGSFDIYTMNSDGSDQINLTATSPSTDFGPSWSPDGKKIVYVNEAYPARDMYVMNADGSDRIQLTTSPNDWEWFPAWSPDGTKIVFQAAPFGEESEIYVMEADGSGVRNLTNAPQATDSEPQWQPRTARAD